MKYEVEITSRVVYCVEANSPEEAEELVVNGRGNLKVADEIEDIEVRVLI